MRTKRMRWERKQSRDEQWLTKEYGSNTLLNEYGEVIIGRPKGMELQRDEFDDGYSDYRDNTCGQCGGDGYIMLSEAGPGAWGEDCFCGEDEPIECPECMGKGVCV